MNSKQTILALVRPKLNLGQPINQVAHLIEHILTSPERLKAMQISDKFFANDIILANGHISDLYCVEYYIVQAKAAKIIKKIIISNQNKLYLNQINFKLIKQVLIEELEEEYTNVMGMDEQFCRAIYCPHSPAIRYSWRDIRNLKSTAKKDIPKIFQRFGRPAYLTELSFGHYLVSEKVKLEKDIFTNKGRFFNLFHPHHSIKTTSIDILVPLKLNKKDLIIFNLYRKVLADPFLGLLIEELRGKKGMIYDISLNYNFYNDSVHFSYSCDKNKTYENIRAIRQTLENLKQKLGRKINLAKERFTLELDLDWSDISRAVLYYLDEAFLGEFDIAPKDQISKIKSLSSKNLLDFNRHILQKLERDSYIVFSNYGQEVEQKILKEIKIR